MAGPMLNALRAARSFLVSVPLVYMATVLWGTLSLVGSLFDASGRWQRACEHFWARMLLRICRMRVRVRGLEHLPKGRPCLIAANHQSYLDIPVAFGHLPVTFRIMAKVSLFHIPFLGWHLRRAGHLPIDRTNPRRAARSALTAAAHVRGGIPVFVFPEGGRSRDGRLGEFKAGTFLLAIKAGVPVVPVSIRGTRRALAFDSWVVHPAEVELILHAPIPTEGLHSRDSEALSDRVKAVIAEGLGTS
jgi:1-acyl-sn-glycerol-3-phosphate acyltransferase